MYHEFPIIATIDDVKPHINQEDGFGIFVKDGYTIFDYIVPFGSTFPEVNDYGSAVRRECRGLLFDSNGDIVSRPLHKFFNLNEKTENSEDNIHQKMTNKRYQLLDKLDGSMIHTHVNSQNQIVYCTRRGVTDVALLAKAFVESSPLRSVYENFIEEMWNLSVTPIFEYCGHDNQVVIEHEQPHMTLIALRSIYSGEYINFDKGLIADILMRYPIPHLKSPWIEYMHQTNSRHIEVIKDQTYSATGIEGYVMRFEDGHMVKIKSDWYCTLHRTIDNISRYNDIVPMIVTGMVDDLLPKVPKYKLPELTALIEKVDQGRIVAAQDLQNQWESTKHLLDIDRKTFALAVTGMPDDRFRAIMFRLANNGSQYRLNIPDSVILINQAIVDGSTGSQEKYKTFLNKLIKLGL